jgi:hypothetical protein
MVSVAIFALPVDAGGAFFYIVLSNVGHGTLEIFIIFRGVGCAWSGILKIGFAVMEQCSHMCVTPPSFWGGGGMVGVEYARKRLG